MVAARARPRHGAAGEAAEAVGLEPLEGRARGPRSSAPDHSSGLRTPRAGRSVVCDRHGAETSRAILYQNGRREGRARATARPSRGPRPNAAGRVIRSSRRSALEHRAEVPRRALRSTRSARSSIDAVQKANSGHPGLPLGAAPMAYVLWQRHLRHNPRDPHWPDRDRFVLSAGHGCMLLYSLLHLTGYDLTLDDLKAFRQWGSRTPGPSRGPPDAGRRGDDRAARPGHGQRRRAWRSPSAGSPHRFNRPGHTIVDHRTFCLVADGDLMEGISSRGRLARRPPEARQAHLPLRRQPRHARRARRRWSFTEDVLRALRGVRLAGAARRERQHGPRRRSTRRSGRPSRSRSGRRSSSCARRSATARRTRPARARRTAARSGAEEVALTKKALGWEWTDPFHVPEEALRHFRARASRGA